MQHNSPPAPFPTAPGYRLDNGVPASVSEVKFVREGSPDGESFLAIKVRNRAPVFPAWLRLLMIGGSSLLLWSALIWAALEIARWV